MKNNNDNGELPIKPNTSLAEAMSFIIKASGLVQIIQDIVTDAVRNNVSHPKQEVAENKPEYYSRTELCQLLHISETTLWRLVNKKKAIREHKVGGKNLYLRSEIDAFIASGASTDSSTILSATEK